VQRVELATHRLAVVQGARVRLITVDEALWRHRRTRKVGLLPLPWK